MFDIGFWELFLVLMVVLIVLGPNKLPIVAHQLGRWLGKAKRLWQRIDTEISQEIDK